MDTETNFGSQADSEETTQRLKTWPAYAGGQAYADEGGINKLEYFAAHAMQGFIANGASGDVAIVAQSIRIAEQMVRQLNNRADGFEE